MMLGGGQSRTCVLGTTSLLILALHVLPVADSAQGPVYNHLDERTLKGDPTESGKAPGSRKKRNIFDDAADEGEDEDEDEGEDMVQRKGKGKGKGKGRKRRGKGGRRRSKGSKSSYDGCPCFDAKDIDEHWHMAKDKHMDDDPCGYVEYYEDGNEAYLSFIEDSDDGAAFEFYVANDNNIGECGVSVYYDPPKGDAEVDRSVTGMGFKNTEVTDHCIDEMEHSAMYQECRDPQ